MRNVTIMVGLLAKVSLGLMILGAALVAWMVIAGSAGWGLGLTVVAIVAIALAGLRTVVVATPAGLRILGERRIPWDDIVDVHLVQDKRICFPQLTLARGRSLEARDLDGLADVNEEAARAQVANLASLAGVEIVEDASTDHGPIAPRRGFSN